MCKPGFPASFEKTAICDHIGPDFSKTANRLVGGLLPSPPPPPSVYCSQYQGLLLAPITDSALCVFLY